MGGTLYLVRSIKLTPLGYRKALVLFGVRLSRVFVEIFEMVWLRIFGLICGLVGKGRWCSIIAALMFQCRQVSLAWLQLRVNRMFRVFHVVFRRLSCSVLLRFGHLIHLWGVTYQPEDGLVVSCFLLRLRTKLYLREGIGSIAMIGRLFGVRICRNGSVSSFGLREASGSSLIRNGFDGIWRAPLAINYAIRVMMNLSFMPFEIALLLLVCGAGLLWKRRCSILLDPQFVEHGDVLLLGKRLVQDYRKVAELRVLVGSRGTGYREGEVRKWFPPRRG
ncbi:hypothetical protein V6N12_032878 [Hibiscus sabdariffa]|uniref:Uncharacterized protein n=1 Tax=Hibiscus sabdariffa TaxID=183260 RepID=A0ABR2BB74_9ROSI